MTIGGWLGAVALFLGCWLAMAGTPRAADDKGPAVPLRDDDFDRLVEQAGKVIDTSLKGKPNESAVEKARTSAIVLAAVAQYSQDPKNATRRREVREVALKVAEALKDDKFAEARAAAATLAKPPAAGKAAAQVAIMDQQISLKDVMHHYASGRGGLGGEKKLDDLADNALARKTGVLPAKELNDDVIALALRSAAIGELLKDHSDDKVKKEPVAGRLEKVRGGDAQVRARAGRRGGQEGRQGRLECREQSQRQLQCLPQEIRAVKSTS
jgi:hypothetical protein